MKRALTVEEKLKGFKRGFYVLLCVLIVLVSAVGCFIYLNYDYLAFKYFMSQYYLYTGTLDSLYGKELKTDAGGRYYSYFDNFVISIVTRYIRESNNDRYTYLYIPEQYRKSKIDEKTEAEKSEVRVLNDKTVYLHIANFSKYTDAFLNEKADQLKRYPYLIIDLRGDLGGDIDAMVSMAGHFLEKGSIVATDSLRILNKVYRAGNSQKMSFDRIFILQDKYTASASENFIAALKENLTNVTLIGEKTFGKGIGQFTLPLRRGYAVKATILYWYTPKGNNIQGKGIQPDIPYSGDDILQYAAERITR